MNAFHIESWSGFLSICASVSATLTGLIFVAVSINLGRILEFPGLPDRAAESILHLFGALILALVALVPGQSNAVLGGELVLIGIVLWILETLLQYRSIKRPWERPVLSIALAHISLMSFCFGGVSLMIRSLGGLYWPVPGMIFSMTIGVSSAWVLLVEILR